MSAAPRILRRMIDTLEGSERICVAGHIRPDGDCVGSQLALARALQARGKTVVCWNEDPIPRKLAFLDPEGMIQPPRPGQACDCVVAVDCASPERLGSVVKAIARRRVLLNVDHHASNTRYGDLHWVSARSPSTGEMLFRLLKVAGWPITPPIADALFTAISTDTGSFQYPTTLPATYRAAGELVELGANLGTLCDRIYQSQPLARVRLLRHLYNRFRLAHRDRIAYCWVRQKDYARTGARPDDSEGLIDHLRAIDPVVVACLFEEVNPNLTRVSLRSKNGRVDVNGIACLFGGGGHAAAAGARIPGRGGTIQRQVLAAIGRALDQARNGAMAEEGPTTG